MPSGTYLGKSTMGNGAPIPVTASGAVDINALIGQMVDRRKTYVFDTYTLIPGGTVPSTPIQFFRTPIGQPDPYNSSNVKTELDTNMRSAGFFNPPYDMIVNNLGFLFLFNNDLYDIEQFMQMGWFDFKILEKTMWSGHLWRHPPGAGMTGMSTTTGQQVWNNGTPEPGAIWYFGDFKKYIPPMVNFSLSLNFPESYNSFYTGTSGTATSIPADISTELAAAGLTGTAMPTIKAQGRGGRGIKLIAFMNGLSDSPVQTVLVALALHFMYHALSLARHAAGALGLG